MGTLERLFISIIIFSLAITAGALTQAGQDGDGANVASVERVPQANLAAVELVEARFEDSVKAEQKPAKNLYPTTLWVLGSALLAMVGYKRMRNTVTGTD